MDSNPMHLVARRRRGGRKRAQDSGADAATNAFRDPATGDLRLDALAQAVRGLQAKLQGQGAAPDERPDVDAAPEAVSGDTDPDTDRETDGARTAPPAGAWAAASAGQTGRVPGRPEDYPIQPPHPLVQPDGEVNRALFNAGVTDKQAQLVYDLAADRMLPAIKEMAREFEADRQADRLAREFGGDEAWTEAAEQLATWGRKHLPREVFDALATTYDGVMAMHRMMQNGETGLAGTSGETAGGESEDELRRLMADPRYWRDRDPATVKRVQNGFKKLYGG